MKTLTVGILAGEMSGDILGAGLMRALKARHPDIRFSGIGGDLMSAEGLDSLVPIDRLSVMGFVEPLKRLPELLRIRRQLIQQQQDNPPDVFIGIDSPDFCLGVEEKLKGNGILTVHYTSPSVWAWRQRRIIKIRRAVDLMLTLFPFEADFYQQHQVPVCFVGHPLADDTPMAVDSGAAREGLGLRPDKPVLALLPGSRQGEVARLADPFLAAARLYHQDQPEGQIVIPAANASRRLQLETLLAEYPELPVHIVDGRSREVMAAADQLLIASGTATLEALLLKKPMVVAYRLSPMTYAIASRLVKLRNFSLPNLLAGEALVPELLQQAVTAEALYAQLRAQQAPEERIHLQEVFTRIHQSLKRGASDRAAEAVLELICSRA